MFVGSLCSRHNAYAQRLPRTFYAAHCLYAAATPCRCSACYYACRRRSGWRLFETLLRVILFMDIHSGLLLPSVSVHHIVPGFCGRKLPVWLDVTAYQLWL